MTAIPLTDEARARLAAAHEELEGELGLSCSTSCGRDCFTVLGCAPTDGEPLRGQSTTTTTDEVYDPINAPAHYTWIPGVEVIDITKHLNFCLGNVVKYVVRCDHKGAGLLDLHKAMTYLQIEIDRRETEAEQL